MGAAQLLGKSHMYLTETDQEAPTVWLLKSNLILATLPYSDVLRATNLPEAIFD